MHHPVAMMDYYHDQKPEAARAAKQFREERLPKYLGHFEDAAQAFTGKMGGAAAHAEPGAADELAKLKAELAALQAKVDKLGQ